MVNTDYYKIEKEKIIVIGDSENDLSAIEFAGMGNISEEVKKKSKFIIERNSKDGVSKAIEKFILATSN